MPVRVFEYLGFRRGQSAVRSRKRLDRKGVVVVVEGGDDVGGWNVGWYEGCEVEMSLGRHC